MKKQISKVALIFSLLFFILGILYIVLSAFGGRLFHGHTEFSTILSAAAVFGAGAVFLALYRIIDLMENTREK